MKMFPAWSVHFGEEPFAETVTMRCADEIDASLQSYRSGANELRLRVFFIPEFHCAEGVQ